MIAPRVDIRLAGTEDRAALWDWRNASVLRHALDLDWDPSYAAFRGWFDAVLRRDDVALLIATIATQRIGIVRFDRIGADRYAISAHLKPAYCGKRLMPVLIDAAVRYLAVLHPIERIEVTVPCHMPATERIFLAAGFTVSAVADELRCRRIIDARGPGAVSAS